MKFMTEITKGRKPKRKKRMRRLIVMINVHRILCDFFCFSTKRSSIQSKQSTVEAMRVEFISFLPESGATKQKKKRQNNV